MSSCSDNNNQIEEQEDLAYEEQLNVRYGESADQVYDIYLPENRTFETKVMVLVHGGGWTSGDKEDMDDLVDFMSQELPNIAVVNMNYRLASESNPPLPMQMEDITSVINSLEENKDEYQISDEIGFIGTSAGAHLALLWSYDYDINNKVNMVCSIVGPTNLADDTYVNSEIEALRDLIFQFGIEIDELEEASPLSKATSLSPPTILFYGAIDPLVPTSQGTDLANRLDELSVRYEFTLYPNGAHGWVGEDLLDTSVKLKAFIGEHL